MSRHGTHAFCGSQSTTTPATRTSTQPQTCPAHSLTPPQRQQLAIQILAGTTPVASLARQHQVSRKFLAGQAGIARDALDHAFRPPTQADDVLFYLPVTKLFVRRLVLALILVAHCSYRGVIEILGEFLGYHVCLGTIHNIVQAAVVRARDINGRYRLPGVRHGAHDEIFQTRQPVLVGVDTRTTFCYLLRQEEHRDGPTWARHLKELIGRGFAPEAIITDGGSGLRAGHRRALPGVVRRGDIFHVLRDLGRTASYLENRAYKKLEQAETQRRRRETARRQDGRSRAQSEASAAQRLRRADADADAAVALYDEVVLLAGWLRDDVLALEGPCSEDRVALFDFIVAEVRTRVARCPHRLRKNCTQLAKQRDELLAFAPPLDRELDRLARRFQTPVDVLRRLLGAVTRDERNPWRWYQESAVQARLGGRFHAARCAVVDLASRTVRASSLVENINSRLRNYFTLRRHLGADYLELLQFFLNHHRLERSDRVERQGKTPAELLTGESHPHWLEMLGELRPVAA